MLSEAIRAVSLRHSPIGTDTLEILLSLDGAMGRVGEGEDLGGGGNLGRRREVISLEVSHMMPKKLQDDARAWSGQKTPLMRNCR